MSSDGVEWRDQGKIINAAADVLWLGSGAVWRSGEKLVMNFSEWRGPSTWEGRQTIFFAVSDDLVRWESIARLTIRRNLRSHRMTISLLRLPRHKCRPSS